MYVRFFRVFKHKKAMDWHGGGRGRMGGATGVREARNREKKRKPHLVRECTQSEKGRKVTREAWAPSAQTLRIKATGD